MAEGEGQPKRPLVGGSLHEVQIGVASTGAADFDQNLTRPRLGHRHVAEFARPLPLDELERFHGP